MSFSNSCNFCDIHNYSWKVKITPIVFNAWLNHNNCSIHSHTYINPVWKTREERGLVLNGNQYGIHFIATFKNEDMFVSWGSFWQYWSQWGKLGIRIYRKNRGTILFYDVVHTVNGLELMGPFRHAASLFVHTLD